MPEVRVGDRRIHVATGSNLLDSLLQAGVAVPHSCRAGSCQACVVHCLAGEPLDDRPDALDPQRRQAGWRLACQCRVVEDLQLQTFDPLRDGTPAQIQACDWLSQHVLRLRLAAQPPVRYRAGQHLLLWTAEGIARPYSLASLPVEDACLEFHVDCRQPGAFSDAARQFTVGTPLRLGALSGGALHYDPDWQARPLWLIGSGTGLAPLYAVLREALRQAHQGPIRVMHIARSPGDHYLAEELAELAGRYPQMEVELVETAGLPEWLKALRLASRQTIAMLCGRPETVELVARRLYLAGLPRSQLFTELFLPHA